MTVAYSTGVIGFGGSLQYGDPATTALPTTLGAGGTAVGQVASINWSGAKVGEEDISNMGSPDTSGIGWEEKAPGTINPGTISVEIVFDSKGTKYSALHALAGVMKQWNIILPTGTAKAYFAFNGFISDIGAELKTKNATSVKMTITISSVVVFTAGT